MATKLFKPGGHSEAGGKASTAGRKAFGKSRRPHPATTMVVQHTHEDTEFLRAIEHWRSFTGRRRPEWSEIAEIVGSLGYRLDPGACGIGWADYDEAVWSWRERTGYRWPTWTDILRIIEALGFRKADSDDEGSAR